MVTIAQDVRDPEPNEYQYERHFQDVPKNPDGFIDPTKALIYLIQGNRG